MEWNNFWQIIIGFSTLVLSIVLFQLLSLDINFIVTFVLAMFSLGISIYFFIQSNYISGEIKERLSIIDAKISPDAVDFSSQGVILSDAEIKQLDDEGDLDE